MAAVVSAPLDLLDRTSGINSCTQPRRSAESRRIGAICHQPAGAKCGDGDIDEKKFSHRVLLVMFPASGANHD
jgi:hypothetical protein